MSLTKDFNVKVFVAGSRGLVGSSLVRTAPDSVEILSSTRSELDLRDKLSVMAFLKRHKPDAIILAAARVGGINANRMNQTGFLVDNLTIQNSVMCAAQELSINNLIFLGSSCIYPKLASQPISEDSLLTGKLESTNEGYAIAKIAGVRLAQAIHEEFGLNYFSLMPTNLYGPNDNFDLETSHVPAALMMKFHLAKIQGLRQVTLWGSGNPKREFMYVDDLSNACWFLLNKDNGGKLFNIGTGQDISIRDFAITMAKIVGFRGNINFDVSMPDGTPRKLLDVSRIHNLGWTHKIDIVDGLEITYKWFVSEFNKGALRGQK